MKNEDGKNKNTPEPSDDEDEASGSDNMAGVSISDIKEHLNKKPKKGILKPSTSFESPEAPSKREKKKSAKWDEMNIIATLHPADKDYGHMKIDEPPTPYEPAIAEYDERDGTQLDATALADKIRLAAEEAPKAVRESRDSTDSESDDDETPEQRAQRKEFEMKRKAHYNEFFAAKLARQLMEEDEDEDDDDAEEGKEGEEEGEYNESESKTTTVPSQSPAGTSSKSPAGKK